MLVDREVNVTALPGIPHYALQQLLYDNDLVRVCCEVATIIDKQGGFTFWETHADRGDDTRPALYEHKWRKHAPYPLLPCFQAMKRTASPLHTFWFH